MVKKFICGAAIAIAAIALPLTPPRAATAGPAAGSVLFETPHLADVHKGDVLAYRLTRAASEPKMLGEPFSDDIKVTITDEDQSGTRDLVVDVFSGERGRPPHPISGMTGNPLLVVYLDRVVNNTAMLAGGSRPFLKQKIKMSFANDAFIAPAEITYKGRSVPGHWIKVRPFVGDPNALKMMGYDGLTLEIVVSDQVPGHLVNLSSHYSSPMKGSPELNESITLEGVSEIRGGGAQ